MNRKNGDGEMIYDENLPYKYIHPGTNYYAFSESEDSVTYLCSCQKESIENRILLFEKYFQYDLCLNDREWLLMEKHLELPLCIDDEIKQSGLSHGLEWMRLFRFKDKLCHMCNCVTPNTKHTIYIYASKLNQQYGHYINSHIYTYGISGYLPNFYGIYFLEDKMPEDFKRILIPSMLEVLEDIQNRYGLEEKGHEKVKLELEKIWNLPKDIREIIIYGQNEHKYLREKGYHTSYDLSSSLGINEKALDYLNTVIHIRYKSVEKIIKDEVKQSFKLKRWVNESLLANIIIEIFQGYTIYRNYRPTILGGLELDIFIQELKVGIEYQGIQHVKSVKTWGGEEGLKIRKEHDKKKAKLCKENKIDLIYFWYNEDITKELV